MSGGPSGRIKVAVLGGGAGALTAALALTDPARAKKYDVSVYTLGWRLGGKGASGRNAEFGNRIEEHGIHVWFGFYDNAFALLDGCYQSLVNDPQKGWKTPEGKPVAFQTCVGQAPNSGAAFYPHQDFVVNEESRADGRWSQWPMKAPFNERRPGDGQPVPAEQSLAFIKLAEMMQSITELRRQDRKRESVLPPVPAPDTKDDEERRFLRFVRKGREGTQESATALGPEDFLEQALDGLAAPKLDEALAPPKEGFLDDEHRFRLRLRFVAWTLRCARASLKPFEGLSPAWHRLYLSCDTFAAVATGLARDVFSGDGTPDENMRALEALELRAWLATHGADGDYLLRNPTVRFIYNSAFAFKDGDHLQPRIAAGSALRGVLRLFLTYKGAFAYRMSSGMGDVVFSPIYELLVRREAQVKFFHRVDELIVADVDGRPVIERIRMTEQVVVKDRYDPFTWVGDFPCWPSEPKFDQLEDGAEVARAIRGGALNLEDPGATWKGSRPVELVRGEDFDEVVLGIPVEALKKLARPLREHASAGPAWRAMLDNAATTPTQAFQVWFRGDLRTLGWDAPPPVFGTYVEPIDTYIDMTPALALEDRRADDVKNLSYFCGVMEALPNETHAQAMARAERNAVEHLTQRCDYIWPALRKGADFRWELLWGGRPAADPLVRFRAGQYSRANVLPSELYTLNLPGSSHHRIAPDAARTAKPGTAFANLWLAGDWTANPINLGCVEATVMSGLMAARGLMGEKLEIVGEHDDYMWRSIGKGDRVLSRRESLSEPAAAAPVAIAVEQQEWGEDGLGRLAKAVDAFDRLLVEALCAALVRSLEASDPKDTTHSAAEAKEVLSALRRKRHFELMEAVAEAYLQAGFDAPLIRRQYAQALIDQARIPTALAVLRDVASKATTDDKERAEGLGLMGRAFKQLHVNLPDAIRAKQRLLTALGWYKQGYDVRQQPWHAVNLLALVARAKRLGIPLGDELGGLNAEALAKQVRANVDAKPRSELDEFDAAIAAEATLFLDRETKPAEVVARYREYVARAGDAFEIASTKRQVEEIWGLTIDAAPGDEIIPVLHAELLKKSGGRVELTGQQIQRTRSRAQKTYGADGALSLDWYRKGLDRCRLVARVSNLSRMYGGSGFLVLAGDMLKSGYPDELLLLTNAHVLQRSPRDPETLRPAEALVRFEAAESPQPEPGYRIKEIVWSSVDLDATLARLDPAPQGLDPYPFAPAPPDPRKKEARIYVIGHPNGGGLSLSLYDNLLLDTDGKVFHYRTPTEPGSSGSPVFDDQWELVALHRAGDRLMPRLNGLPGTYAANEGVSIAAIRQALR